MSIKIHHGPNGSYKTSGAIQDDAVPALKEGRLIITNVRGFTLERVLQVMPDLPSSVDIINLDLESLDDMERMRTWFQWAPRGAFIIFDETQLVFPKAWRERDLERFDFPGGPEEAAKADRPMSWLDGWTRHRHWNWDIVLTTPNIAYIRDDIRMTCEMAYKHSNLAVIGISGRYKEAQHDAQVNRPPMEGTVIEYKRIKPDTFRLYQSTATGVTQDTKAGKSLLRSPKLLALLAFMALLVVALLSLGGVDFGPAGVAPDGDPPAAASPALGGAPPAVSAPASAALRIPVMGDQQNALSAVELNHPLAPRTFVLQGVIQATRDGKPVVLGSVAVVDADGSTFSQRFEDLRQLGYGVYLRNGCYVEIRHPMGFTGAAICPGGKPLNQPSRLPESKPVALSSQPATSTDGMRVTVVPDNEYPARPWR
jgi:zona occludens toxin